MNLLTTYNNIRNELNKFITTNNKNDKLFQKISLDIFQFQYKCNKAYKDYCDWCNIDINNINNWFDIPPIPVTAFKKSKLFVFDSYDDFFLTSGTTKGLENRGKHYYKDLDLYKKATLISFDDFVLNENPDNYNLYILGIPFENAINSSLYYMIEKIANHFFQNRYKYYYSNKNNKEVIEYENAIDDLKKINSKVIIIGTTAALINLCDRIKNRNLKINLPKDSKIVDTGGVKGLDKELERHEILEIYQQFLNINNNNVINEYGMTELFSQYYSSNLIQSTDDSDNKKDFGLISSPWLKFRIVDPKTNQEVEDETRGIICHYDILNIHSVMAIMTGDIGYKKNGQLFLEGRATDADLRGCSLTISELSNI